MTRTCYWRGFLISIDITVSKVSGVISPIWWAKLTKGMCGLFEVKTVISAATGEYDDAVTMVPAEGTKPTDDFLFPVAEKRAGKMRLTEDFMAWLFQEVGKPEDLDASWIRVVKNPTDGGNEAELAYLILLSEFANTVGDDAAKAHIRTMIAERNGQV